MSYSTFILQFLLDQEDYTEPANGWFRIVEIHTADSYVEVLVYVRVVDVVSQSFHVCQAGMVSFHLNFREIIIRPRRPIRVTIFIEFVLQKLPVLFAGVNGDLDRTNS